MNIDTISDMGTGHESALEREFNMREELLRIQLAAEGRHLRPPACGSADDVLRRPDDPCGSLVIPGEH